jgi:hypothetical protein
MPLIDDDGRLFGRVNLFDALAAAVVLAMIPLGYAAYLLFRPPPAKLVAVEPKQLTQGPNRRLQLWGENLRPFMRISLNDVQARTFLIESPKGAEADLPDTIEPGTYDVVLYDYARELHRLPKAVTIVPNAPVPTLSVEASGAFVGIDANAVKLLTAGLRLAEGPSIGDVISVEPPLPARMRVRAGDAAVGVPIANGFEVPATVRVRCFPESNVDGSVRCMVPGERQAMTLTPDALITFRASGAWLPFQVSEVHLDPKPAMAEVRVRFVGASELLGRLKVGDVDTSTRVYSRAHAARIVSLDPIRAPSSAPPAFLVVLAPGEQAGLRDAVLRLPVERTANGWTYRNRGIKAGVAFAFETATYLVQGQVLGATFSETAPEGEGEKPGAGAPK